jgi:hypothetical protein
MLSPKFTSKLTAAPAKDAATTKVSQTFFIKHPFKDLIFQYFFKQGKSESFGGKIHGLFIHTYRTATHLKTFRKEFEREISIF